MGWDGLENIDEVESLGSEDMEVLHELRSVLEKHGAQGRFGVTLLHSHFELEPGELLVEKVDVSNRKLIIEPIPEAELEPEQLMVTSWRLDGPDATPRPLLHCFRFKDHHAI